MSSRPVSHLDAAQIALLLEGSANTAAFTNAAHAVVERNVLERAAELLRASCSCSQPDHPEAVEYAAAAAELAR